MLSTYYFAVLQDAFQHKPALLKHSHVPDVHPVSRRTPILGIAHEYRISPIAADMILRPWRDGAR